MEVGVRVECYILVIFDIVVIFVCVYRYKDSFMIYNLVLELFNFFISLVWD